MLRKTTFLLIHSTTVAVATAICGILAPSAEAASFFSFTPVVNNGDLIPNTNNFFNSYNQPSINERGLVVFRARSQGGAGQPVSGIFARDMGIPGSPINTLATRTTAVPFPNNTGATFNEFPSFPRIDSETDMLAFRGQSQPVWQVIDPSTGETVTKVGTTGVYTTNPAGDLITGATQLGSLSDFSFFQVPGATAGTKFDQFPGAPSPTDGNTVAFKGNWTDSGTGTGKTGVYFRNVLANGGQSIVNLIADSNTLIPGTTLGTKFGSTAPPSAAKGQAVFLGVDNEENPTEGGIYQALLSDPTILNTVVALGSTPAGTDKAITRLGEALSFDGRNVAYWGALGTETRTITLSCPTEGNKDLVEFCNQEYPEGFTTEVPVNQGIFLTDVKTLETRLVAQTGSDYADFVFWNFSGRPPGVGEGEEGTDAELARWRSTSFVATEGSGLVFKALKTSGVQGLYSSLSPDLPIHTVVETGMDGGILDPQATGLLISSLGVERDGFRKGQLVFNASMLGTAEEDSWAGIYYGKAVIPTPALLPGLIGMGVAVLRKRRDASEDSSNT
ncbi:MAG TPA: PTPA-CTERM sorting domain-containing protein [Leptolyngbyaceae cyanobacterium M33_DOE_097]|uniref:PTPA-CTERM sorting domain-containing protein n=1 Tax=Oscillatoriales cyanobacterium SpSt-418 TaxID=2282169 RepID=A0A7C3PPE6_9CYAN|nr:PTPA-CTERM sorting domain-containing protein [Leptolyngbyaceae cyanobacterium M33_DOE_097]